KSLSTKNEELTAQNEKLTSDLTAARRGGAQAAELQSALDAARKKAEADTKSLSARIDELTAQNRKLTADLTTGGQRDSAQLAEAQKSLESVRGQAAASARDAADVSKALAAKNEELAAQNRKLADELVAARRGGSQVAELQSALDVAQKKAQADAK